MSAVACSVLGVPLEKQDSELFFLSIIAHGHFVPLAVSILVIVTDMSWGPWLLEFILQANFLGQRTEAARNGVLRFTRNIQSPRSPKTTVNLGMSGEFESTCDSATSYRNLRFVHSWLCCNFCSKIS